MDPLLITIQEAAKMVGIGRDRAYAMVRSGEWESVLIGKRQRRVPRAFIQKLYGVSSCEHASAQESV